MMTTDEKLQVIRDTADEMKAERIETLNVREKTSMADYFVVCSGNSDRHVEAIADRVAEKMREKRSRPTRVEGERSGWVLQDYGDIVLHVMREEQRQFYDLETLWQNMKPSPDLSEGRAVEVDAEADADAEPELKEED
jgi:ribosome-associated protein